MFKNETIKDDTKIKRKMRCIHLKLDGDVES
jgi:hypothetical protein